MVYVTGENIIQKQRFVGDTKVMSNIYKIKFRGFEYFQFPVDLYKYCSI